MEGPAWTLSLRTCYVKHCRPLGIPELGQAPLSRSCCCSCRIVKQERSSSVSKRALPIILEYPGFQDVKLSKSYLGNRAFNQIFQGLERGKNSSAKLNHFPRRGWFALCLGSCCSKGHQPTSPGLQDKPLQECSDKRLMGLGSYESKRCNRKTKGFAEKTQPLRGCRRGSSCSAVLLVGHGKEGQQPCSSASQHCKGGTECKAQKEIQNVLQLLTGDLDLVTPHITAPLEAFAQRKRCRGWSRIFVQSWSPEELFLVSTVLVLAHIYQPLSEAEKVLVLGLFLIHIAYICFQ